MQDKEWTNPALKKEEWIDGVWKTEPDKMQFTDAATGMPCLIVRNQFGALCGYVGVDDKHPLFGKGYDAANEKITCSHGGITFTGECQEIEQECEGICHKVEEGENDKVWWLGFDCNHAYDFAPAMETRLRKYAPELANRSFQLYRDVPYVKAVISEVAKALKAAA